MGWSAASNPFWAASLGGNTTLPVGLFRQHRSSCRRSGGLHGFEPWGRNATVGRHRFKQRGWSLSEPEGRNALGPN